MFYGWSSFLFANLQHKKLFAMELKGTWQKIGAHRCSLGKYDLIIKGKCDPYEMAKIVSRFLFDFATKVEI